MTANSGKKIWKRKVEGWCSVFGFIRCTDPSFYSKVPENLISHKTRSMNSFMLNWLHKFYDQWFKSEFYQRSLVIIQQMCQNVANSWVCGDWLNVRWQSCLMASYALGFHVLPSLWPSLSHHLYCYFLITKIRTNQPPCECVKSHPQAINHLIASDYLFIIIWFISYNYSHKIIWILAKAES